MKIALIHAPPWKIREPDQPPYAVDDGGPPTGVDPYEIGGDFLQIPYGLLSLTAGLRDDGHAVVLLNLADFTWRRVQTLLDATAADLFGISCQTVNRRGVAAVVAHLRAVHPKTHIVLGGPHVTPLPRETLHFLPAVDTVVIGEGEDTLRELVSRLTQGLPTAGIPGTATRTASGVVVAPARNRIKDLDRLPAPVHQFACETILTSRGCPGKCTFCASSTTWKGGLRFHSVAYILDTLETAVHKHKMRGLAIKDDTFTANRKRALAVCEEIQRRQLNFLWSCDTRADCLDEELLLNMRLAGCQQISLGVESGSAAVLKRVQKKIDLDTVLNATAMARKYGFEIRYYMMVGSFGETAADFNQSLAFIRSAGPHRYGFSAATLYPGTSDFDTYRQRTGQSAEIFFTNPFTLLLGFMDMADGEARKILNWLGRHRGFQSLACYSADQAEAILKRLPGHGPALMEMGLACLREDRWSDAATYIRQALERDYPLAGVAHNALACVAAAQGDFDEAHHRLARAGEFFPAPVSAAHRVIAANQNTLAQAPAAKGMRLNPNIDFEATIVYRQPVYPGPVGDVARFFVN